jgi:hypothetical protein
MNNNTNKITQFISAWNDGKRTTVQFFPHLMQVWVIVRNNTGRLVSRNEISIKTDSWDFIYSAYESHPSFTKYIY